MEANDYRLERWLAVLLSLLFFLPFVARADELVYPGLYTDERVPYQDGDSYLAIGPATLVPVKIRVESGNVEADDVHTLTNIEVVGFENAWLVRGKNLRPGPIVRAIGAEADLVIGRTKKAIALGATKYELSYRCAEARCALVLACGGVVQELTTVPAHFAPGDEPEHRLLFAGDLDRDGRLDLIANHTDRAWDWYPTLWLSSAAGKGELVGKAAQLAATADIEC